VWGLVETAQEQLRRGISFWRGEEIVGKGPSVADRPFTFLALEDEVGACRVGRGPLHEDAINSCLECHFPFGRETVCSRKEFGKVTTTDPNLNRIWDGKPPIGRHTRREVCGHHESASRSLPLRPRIDKRYLLRGVAQHR